MSSDRDRSNQSTETEAARYLGSRNSDRLGIFDARKPIVSFRDPEKGNPIHSAHDATRVRAQAPNKNLSLRTFRIRIFFVPCLVSSLAFLASSASRITWTQVRPFIPFHTFPELHEILHTAAARSCKKKRQPEIQSRAPFLNKDCPGLIYVLCTVHIETQEDVTFFLDFTLN